MGPCKVNFFLTLPSSRMLTGVLVARRASQPAEQVAEFAARSSCFEPVSSSSSRNWTAQVESSSSAIWLPDALRGAKSSRAGGADESWLSRRPGWQRSWPLQQCNHAETSRGGCRAVAGENEAARFCDFALKAEWPCTPEPPLRRKSGGTCVFRDCQWYRVSRRIWSFRGPYGAGGYIAV